MAAMDLKLQAMSQSGWMQTNTATINPWPPLQTAPTNVWAQASQLQQHNMNSWNPTPAQWGAPSQISVAQMAHNTVPVTAPHQAQE